MENHDGKHHHWVVYELIYAKVLTLISSSCIVDDLNPNVYDEV